MGRKSTSKSTIKSDKSSSGISLCYIILLSLFAASEGKNWGGRRSSGFFSSLLPRSSCTNSIFSKNTNEVSCSNELAIVPCDEKITSLRGGALNPFPAGYNPFGHSLTDLGTQFLGYDGSLDSDIGKFLSTLKGGKRKTAAVMKEQWLEIVRVGKKAQGMRIYRQLDDIIEFCLKAGFID